MANRTVFAHDGLTKVVLRVPEASADVDATRISNVLFGRPKFDAIGVGRR